MVRMAIRVPTSMLRLDWAVRAQGAERVMVCY